MDKLTKYVTSFGKLPPIVKTILIVFMLGVLLLAIHSALFLLDMHDIRKWLIINLNVNLLLTTFNTTLLFSIFAITHRDKGENSVKHSETNKRIKIIHHHSKSTAKKVEIITRKQFAQDARIDMLEDIILNRQKSNRHENT